MKLKEILKDEKKWLESQKLALIEEIKKIKIADAGYDWSIIEYHYWNMIASAGKIGLIKQLIRKGDG